MNLLNGLLAGALTPVDHRHEESAIPHANPLLRAENPAQPLIDAQHQLDVPSHADQGSGVGVLVRHNVEPVSHYVAHETQTVTAFINQFVPIPYFHGDQPPVGQTVREFVHQQVGAVQALVNDLLPGQVELGGGRLHTNA